MKALTRNQRTKLRRKTAVKLRRRNIARLRVQTLMAVMNDEEDYEAFLEELGAALLKFDFALYWDGPPIP